jgi:hypothetical protein
VCTRRNYLLAQAHVDAPALANSIAHLNTAATFTPLQALQDTDVAGYLRHAHEQNLISTIEEARKETQADFYRLLEDRERRDWEAKKKRVFEELGGRVGGENKAVSELKKSLGGKSLLGVRHRVSKVGVSLCADVPVGEYRTHSILTGPKQDDGIRPRHLGIQCYATSGNVISYSTRSHSGVPRDQL